MALRPRHPRRTALRLALIASAAPLCAQDHATEARIRAELADRGSLTELRAAWRDAPVAQRVALERADGELTRALSLTRDPAERAVLLDASGELDAALLAVEQVLDDADLGVAARGDWLLRGAELRFAIGDAAGAQQALRDIRSLAPERAEPLAHLAGAWGLYALALELDDRAAGYAAAMRRAEWSERLGDFARSAGAYRDAAAQATTEWDRRFALSRLVDLYRQAERLPELADLWLRRGDLTGGEARAVLAVLRELSRGSDALELLARLSPDDPDLVELQRQAMDIALEVGETEAGLALGRERLAADPDDLGIRLAMAWLLMDLDRRPAAAAVLTEALPAEQAGLRAVVDNASQLGLESAIAAALAEARRRGQHLLAALWEVDHLRRHGREAEAAQLLRAAALEFPAPEDRLRLGEALEDLGQRDAALDVYRELYEETRSDDLGMRLAWMLSAGDLDARDQARGMFREIWLGAGSPGRRAQAEERVLSLAAREGTLADLALELEEALTATDTVNRPAVRQALVTIYTRARDSFGAAEVLMAYAGEPDAEVDAWRELAKMHLLAEEYRRHERALRHLLEIDPQGELEYLQQLALSGVQRGRPAVARDVAGEILQRGSAEAFEFAAGIQALAGQHQDAVRTYRRFLARDPDRIEIYLALGQALARAGQRQQAIGLFCEVLLGDARDDLFLVAVDGLLNLEADSARLGFAARAVQRRLLEHPDKVYLYRAQQDLLQTLGETEAHRRSLEATLAVAGEQRVTWLRELMDLARQRGDLADLLRHGRAVLDSEAQIPPRALVELGDALLASGDLAAAERAFGRARFAVDFTAVEDRMALAYQQLGRVADAERLRRRILRRQPDSVEALVALAELVEQRGARDEALRMFGRAVAAAPLPVSRSAPAAITGLLRNARRSSDLQAVRQRTEARLRSEQRQGATTVSALLADLYRTVELWEDDPIPVLRPIEELALEGASRRVRDLVFAARKLRGDLDGAEDVSSGAELELFPLREVDVPYDVEQAATPELLRLFADYQRIGARGSALEFLPVLEQRHRLDPAVGTDLLRAQRLLGLPADRAIERRQLAEAMAGDSRSRVEAVVQALPGLPGAQRAELLAEVLDDALRDPNGYLAQQVLGAGRGVLTRQQLAPLARLAVGSIRQAHLLPARVSALSLLTEAEARELLEEVVDRFSAARRHTHLLRILSDGQLSVDLQRVVLRNVGFDGDAASELQWLGRLCAADLEPDIARSLAGALEEHPDKNAYARILRARLEPAAAPEHLSSAIATLRVGLMDAATLQLLEILAPMLGTEHVARLGDGPVDRFLRGAVQLTDDPESAVRDLTAVCAAEPENLPLLQAVQTRLLFLGQSAAARELYRGYLATRARIEPEQAGHLARLQLASGRAADAMATLTQSGDPRQRGLVLRAIAALPDAEAPPALRRWAQQGPPLVGAPTRRAPTLRHAVGDSLQPVGIPALAPEAPDLALGRGSEADLLAVVTGGSGVARSLLATLDGAGRERHTGLYRSWVRGDAGAVAMARRRRQSQSTDGEALRILFAAVQLGFAVTDDERHRAVRRKALLAGDDAQRLVEVLLTAQHSGEREVARGLLRELTRSRDMLGDVRVRARLGAVLALAADFEPDLLLRMLPGGRVDPYLDGALMTALAGYGDLDRCLSGFAAVPVFLEQRRSLFAGLRLALPWAGLSLRAGDLDAVQRALTIADSSLETGDEFPVEALGAAIPPLALWRDPGLATGLGRFLLAQCDRGPFGRQLLFHRLVELLARRLEAADRGAEAAALRAGLRR